MSVAPSGPQQMSDEAQLEATAKLSIEEMLRNKDDSLTMKKLCDLRALLLFLFGTIQSFDDASTEKVDGILKMMQDANVMIKVRRLQEIALSPSEVCELLHMISDLEDCVSHFCSHYRNICNQLGSCKLCYAKTTPLSSNGNMYQNMSGMEALFEVPYIQKLEVLEAFKANIKKMLWNWHKHTRDQYAPSISVVQCSGSGKSRMVAELAREIPTIYICNRNAAETRAYPALTPVIVEYLTNGQVHSAVDPDIACYVRAVALMFTVREIVTALYASKHRSSGKWSYGVLWAFLKFQWRKDGEFWAHTLRIVKYWEESILEVVGTTSSVNDTDNMWEYIESLITEKYGLDIDMLPDCRDHDIYFIVCFDEVKILHQICWPNCKQSVMAHIHRASRIFEYRSHRAALIMLDTLCHFPAIVPSIKFTSDRILPMGANLFYFCDLLTWDLGVKYQDEIVVKTATSRNELMKFGRPLWYAHSHKETAEKVINLARSKLCDTKSAQQTVLPVIHNHQLMDDSYLKAAALICCRSSMSMTPFLQLSRNLVCSHMGYLRALDSSTGMVDVGYPSDPILALAAREEWSAMNTEEKKQMLWYVGNMIRYNIVAPGFRGEFVSALICLEPLDRAKSDTIRVADWLKYICGVGRNTINDLGTQVGYSWEDFLKDFVRKEFQSFLGGTIHLSHFIAVKGYTPNQADLFRFFQRGAGVICKVNQVGFDLMIPVVLEDTCYGHQSHQPTTSPHSGVTKGIDGILSDNQRAILTSASVKKIDLNEHVTNLKTWFNINWKPDQSPTSSPPQVDILADISRGDPKCSNACNSLESVDKTVSARNISCILIQCKNYQSRGNAELKMKVNISSSTVTDILGNSDLMTGTSTRKTKRRREMLTSDDSVPPYAIIGMFYTKSERKLATVHQLPSDLEYDARGLHFAITNPQWNFDDMGEAYSELLVRSCDAADAGDSLAARLKECQLPCEYGTYTE